MTYSFFLWHLKPSLFFPPHFISLGPRFTNGISSKLVYCVEAIICSSWGAAPTLPTWWVLWFDSWENGLKERSCSPGPTTCWLLAQNTSLQGRCLSFVYCVPWNLEKFGTNVGGTNELLKSLSIPEIYDFMNMHSQRAGVLIWGGKTFLGKLRNSWAGKQYLKGGTSKWYSHQNALLLRQVHRQRIL